jgi:hypothetical protein
MTASGVVDGRVDLARRGVALERLAELGERDAGLGQLLEHDQGGDEPGVGPVVVAEVVVAGVLAAEHGVGLGHDLLDVGVAHPGADGVPPSSRTTSGTAFEQIRLCRMVEPGFLASMPLATRAVVREPGQELGLLVDEEHPVGVAVEGQADIGADLEHPGLEVALVLGLDRVGRMVREGAVELAVHDLDVEGQALEDLGGHVTAHAVGRVGHDLQAGAGPTCRRRSGRARRSRRAGPGGTPRPAPAPARRPRGPWP